MADEPRDDGVPPHYAGLQAGEPRLPDEIERSLRACGVDHGASADEIRDYVLECLGASLAANNACRAQLDAVTRERDELLKILNGPDVVGAHSRAVQRPTLFAQRLAKITAVLARTDKLLPEDE